MFEAVFPFGALPADDVARLCLTTLRIDPAARVRLYEKEVNQRAMCREAQRRQHFDVEVSGYRLEWSGVNNNDLAFLNATGTKEGEPLALVSSLSEKMPLTTARLYDDEYEHWQNAHDPLQYDAVGRSMEGLPMKKNDLPPPLDKMIVDTSRNPGRRILRDGYVEAVGHRMWLGSEFFRRVPGTRRDAIISASALKVTELREDLLDIVAHDEPFIDSSTADLQDRLRRLLFPTTAGT